MITQRELDLLAPPPGPGLVTLPARAALPAVRRGSAAPSRLLGWGFVAPALALLLALNIFPLAFNVYLSFTDADLSGGTVNAVGAGFLWSGHSLALDSNKAGTPAGSMNGGSTNQPSIDRRYLIGDVLLGAAGASAITGALLYFWPSAPHVSASSIQRRVKG